MGRLLERKRECERKENQARENGPPQSLPQESKDPPARPSDLSQCISSWRKPMHNGYIDWGLKNSCEVTITFDIDDCDSNEDMQPVCEVKTLTVAARSETSGSNYHKPANARNYR
jgi:hypothetical protein